MMKLRLLSLALLVSINAFSQNFTSPIFLDTRTTGTLGSADGNNLLQVTFGGGGGSGGNLVLANQWLLRNGAGSDWFTVNIVDGVSVDGSFTTAATSRTWWKRDPYNQTHAWGSGASSYMSLSSSRLGLFTSPQGTVHLNSSGVYWSSYNYGAGLLVDGTAHHNAIGLIDSSHGNMAIANVDGALVIAKMPALGNTSTPPTAIVNVLPNGNVGIGTSVTNGYKLGVEGVIGAREVNVNTLTWFDYVFDADYKLPSLETVEKFIKQHHHLPEIPTAKQVEANGVNVGEMNALLLKKIEEMTLYIIELKKRVDVLENKK